MDDTSSTAIVHTDPRCRERSGQQHLTMLKDEIRYIQESPVCLAHPFETLAQVILPRSLPRRPPLHHALIRALSSAEVPRSGRPAVFVVADGLEAEVAVTVITADEKESIVGVAGVCICPLWEPAAPRPPIRVESSTEIDAVTVPSLIHRHWISSQDASSRWTANYRE